MYNPLPPPTKLDCHKIAQVNAEGALNTCQSINNTYVYVKA